jgi:UMF1 family MFS transporter
MSHSGGLWHRLGLGRPELRAWALYDWANSAFITVVVSGLFPPYFAGVASAGAADATATIRLGYGTAIALAIIAAMSPVLGAIGDRAPVKKTLLAAFTGLGVVSTAALVIVGKGDWLLALVLFGLANIGANGAFVFYDALLPHVARGDELDRVSSAGYALGYVGGGLLLAACAALVITPATFGLPDKTAAVQVSFIATAVWWALFAIPLLRGVREPDIARADRVRGVAVIAAGFRDVAHTWQALRQFPQAARLLLAFLVYNDGIGTIYRMATSFGREIGLETGQMITALLIVQVVGVPATFAFGGIAGRIGTRRSIFIGIGLFGVVSVLGYRMQTATDFFFLAGLVGLVQGGTQALSRSLFASMVPRHQSSEFFGLFAVFEKFAGIFGPLVFAIVASIFDSSREAILSLITFFAAGALLLTRVDVADGQRAAAAANREHEAAA